MTAQFLEAYKGLIDCLSTIPLVTAIAKTGGESLPDDEESDIDIMVICDAIPPVEMRREALIPLGEAVTAANLDIDDSPYWGVVDFVSLHGVEVCLMHHTLGNTEAYVNSVLRGERLEKEGDYFYPTGRIASLFSLHVYVDKEGRIAALRDRLRDMPGAFSRKSAIHHADALSGTEDFRRAVSRQDILFFHSVIESALDHYLQALYALNATYFPSRKRTWQYIERFDVKPVDCALRLKRVIELGARPETLAACYDAWGSLVEELRTLVSVKYPAHKSGKGDVDL